MHVPVNSLFVHTQAHRKETKVNEHSALLRANNFKYVRVLIAIWFVFIISTAVVFVVFVMAAVVVGAVCFSVLCLLFHAVIFSYSFILTHQMLFVGKQTNSSSTRDIRNNQRFIACDHQHMCVGCWGNEQA